ncbi:Peroxisomal membrane protein PMP27 [Orbilia ellipsospora]|uniref:Peroxisomal membrane protein PMP27 n=1 Tax=Orbilia ellipsospora TaxID=2528407 RepID=A0AAV9XME5_9PEZI
MDQQTPPRTPVLEGSDPDKELKRSQDALEVAKLDSESTSIVSKPIPTMSTSVGRLLVFPNTALHSKATGRILKLLQSANGIDKIVRTIQYTSRLLSHIMLLKDLHTTATSTAAKGIRRQFGLTRRLLRCFNNLPQSHVTLKLLLERKQRIANDAVGYVLDLIEGIGYTGFGIADSLGYLPDAGIMGIPYKDLVDKMAFNFWLYALVASILGGMLRLYRFRQRLVKYRSIFPATSTAAAIESAKNTLEIAQHSKYLDENAVQGRQELPPTPPDSPVPPNTLASVSDAAQSVVKKLEEQQFNTGLNVMGYAADIIFPLAALNYSGFNGLSDGVLGFVGCVSSAVGLRKAWQATA